MNPEAILDEIETLIDDRWSSGLGELKGVTVGGGAVESQGRAIACKHLPRDADTSVEEYHAWSTSLIDAAYERWGDPGLMDIRDPYSGAAIRTPFTDWLRWTGFQAMDVWWVDDMLVAIAHAFPDIADPDEHEPNYTEEKRTVIAIACPDATFDPMNDTDPAELRRHVRILAELTGTPTTASAEVVRTEFAKLSTPDGVPGPGLLGTAKPADDTRHSHTWYFTPDGRALLVLAVADSPFVGDRSLFDGVPEDLVELAGTRDERARSNTTGVYWFDGNHWHASAGLLLAVRKHLAELRARNELDRLDEVFGTGADSPIAVLLNDGLLAAAYAVGAGAEFDPEFFADSEVYVPTVIGRSPSSAEVDRAFAAVDGARIADTNDDDNAS